MTNGKLEGRAALVAISLMFAPGAAEAHLVETGLGPVYDGVAHFALSPEYCVPIVGAALYAGLRGKVQARSAIVLLPLSWLIGSLLGGLRGAPELIAPPWLVLMLVGGFIAAEIPLSVRASGFFMAAIGLTLGFSSGMAMAQYGQLIRPAFGSAVVIFVVTTLAAAAANATFGWTRIAVRVVGSWIAASGLLHLGWILH
jgi:hydrogenase/urease accessory protein HupE